MSPRNHHGFILGLVIVLLALLVIATFFLSLATPAMAAPPTPTGLKVSGPVTSPTAATFTLTWDDMKVARYRWEAAFNDGTSYGVGSVVPPTTQIGMPYHASGAAAGGYACITSYDAAGVASADRACIGLAVPAKPPGPSASLTVGYLEPSKNVDGSALTDLTTIRLYYRIDGGAEQSQGYQASRPTGGQNQSVVLNVPTTGGTMVLQSTAINAAGLEGPRSDTVTHVSATPGAPTAKPTVIIRDSTRRN